MPGFICCYPTEHPNAGQYWWIVGNTATHVADGHELDIIKTQHGAPLVNPDAGGAVEPTVIDVCNKVYPHPVA